MVAAVRGIRLRRRPRFFVFRSALAFEPPPPAPVRVRFRIEPAVERQVVAVWRNNSDFGPRQVRNQLRRAGVRIDTKTVRKILRAHGYTPPSIKPPRSRECCRPARRCRKQGLSICGRMITLSFSPFPSRTVIWLDAKSMS